MRPFQFLLSWALPTTMTFGQCAFVKQTANSSTLIQRITVEGNSATMLQLDAGENGIIATLALPGDSTRFLLRSGHRVTLRSKGGESWRLAETDIEHLASELTDSVGYALGGMWISVAISGNDTKEALRVAVECAAESIAAPLSPSGTSYTNKPREFVKVIRVDSTRTADELYKAAKRWFVETYKDAQEVLQLDDPASHTLVGKGSTKFSTSVYVASAVRVGWVRYTIEVASKDGRCRLRLYDYTHQGSTSFLGGYSSGPLNLGQLYDAPNCCPDHNSKATKHVLNVCAKEVEPQLSALELSLALSLERFLLNPTGGAAKDDW